MSELRYGVVSVDEVQDQTCTTVASCSVLRMLLYCPCVQYVHELLAFPCFELWHDPPEQVVIFAGQCL